MVECPSPRSSRSERVNVEVSQDDQAFSRSGLVFLYQDVFISYFYPQGGPSAGGTQVNVHGSGFLNLMSLRCKFGDVSVPATWISPEELWCVTPPGMEGEVELEVSNNNLDFSSFGNKYEFQAKTTILRVTPSRGHSGGNTEVTVVGTNFLNT
eukprot:CAMPEP_0117066188 /NCGR_PEP_ID=MMETSP0472-20121206/46285_1 /TAXON_ID=693140 ORGANISM="Tiarina fusus, Strain LIS" /NCGR_SAMPLE_ID=MMETSP0472 /ASSEMBLY_ACC=CAM_ASM_000603 /LENGTH=152 /DNA_ID=CAMNT_0004787141 /DNA_START=229 /DNA_END=684 /DNA_ORIENTATION=+